MRCTDVADPNDFEMDNPFPRLDWLADIRLRQTCLSTLPWQTGTKRESARHWGHWLTTFLKTTLALGHAVLSHGGQTVQFNS